MKENDKSFIFAPFGSNLEEFSHYATAASWPMEETCFNMVNSSYPKQHTHEYFEIFVLLSGETKHYINGDSYVMRKGDACLIRPTDSHYFADVEHPERQVAADFLALPGFVYKLFSVLGVATPELLLNGTEPLSFHISSSLTSVIERNCLYIQSPYPKTHTTSDLQICKSMFTELFCNFVQTKTIKLDYNYPQWLQKLIVELQNSDNFSKKIEEMLVGIPYSYSYVQKQFKKYLSTTIIAYLNTVKLTRAKELLRNTQMTVSELSVYLGYESTAHLNHLFKNAFGMTPIEFRKQKGP